MKIKEGYMLKEIAGNFVAIPVGQNIVNYKGMLHLNESGVFIWNLLKEGITYEDLLQKIILEYEAQEEEQSIIQKDLDEFLDKAKAFDLLIE